MKLKLVNGQEFDLIVTNDENKEICSIPLELISNIYYNSDYNSGSSYYYYIPSSLKTVTITDATPIPYGAFYNCKSLKKITIDCDSDEIKLGSEVFCYCYSLNELIAPKIKSFSNFEFFKCSQIKKIVVHRKCKIDKKFLKKMLTIDCKIKISKKGMTKIITIN